MEKIEKNNKDLEKSGGAISSSNHEANTGKPGKDLDSKNKVLGPHENEHIQSVCQAFNQRREF